MRKAYLDACVAIYYVERHPSLFPKVAAALFPGERQEVALAVSDLTRLECRVFPLRQHDRALLERYDAFFALPEVSHAAMDRAVFDLAAELRAEHGMPTPDAIHLAAAIQSGCAELWTNDKRLTRAAGDRISIVTFS
jgi:predicted nucleic acid-binding protein